VPQPDLDPPGPHPPRRRRARVRRRHRAARHLPARHPGCASNGHAPTIFEQEAEVTAQQAEEGPTSLFGEYLAFQADTEAAVTEFIDGLPSMGGFLEMVPEVWWRAMAGYLSLYYYMEAEITPSGNALSELLSSI
jgi:hypothetical protein